jgi:hypothetical protein
MQTEYDSGKLYLDALRLPAALFVRLPLPGSILGRVDGTAARLCVTSSEAVWRALGSLGGVAVFTALELTYLARAAENGRASPSVMMQWCVWKVTQGWRLSLEEALGGIRGVRTSRSWSIGKTLGAFGVVVDTVTVNSEVPHA